jgi:sugar phosphate isomerase/epimerase
LNEFLSSLARDGYDGTVTLELSPSALRIWNPRSAERKLKEAVDFVRKAIA